MKAVASVPPWNAEDDLLLKNSIEVFFFLFSFNFPAQFVLEKINLLRVICLLNCVFFLNFFKFLNFFINTESES